MPPRTVIQLPAPGAVGGGGGGGEGSSAGFTGLGNVCSQAFAQLHNTTLGGLVSHFMSICDVVRVAKPLEKQGVLTAL